jgi:hypothetical protein
MIAMMTSEAAEASILSQALSTISDSKLFLKLASLNVKSLAPETRKKYTGTRTAD